MSTRRIAKVALVGLVLALVAVPLVALASPEDGAVVSTRTETVSGAEIAGEIVKGLEHVAVGSSGATVTLDVDGAPRDIGLDVSDAQSGIVHGKGSGLAGLAFVSAAVAGLLKGAAVLARLFH